MEYTLLFHEPAADFAARTDNSRPEYWGAWRAYMGAMHEAGVMRGGKALEPASTGAAVRRRHGAREVLDGPYSETREQLGGYVVIEVADMAAALAWAERAPCVETGAVEVRPVMAMAAMGD